MNIDEVKKIYRRTIIFYFLMIMTILANFPSNKYFLIDIITIVVLIIVSVFFIVMLYDYSKF